MTFTLVLDLAGAAPERVLAALATSAHRHAAVVDCDNLVQRVNSQAPDQVVCVAPGLSSELARAVAGWGGDPPCPVWLLSAAAPADSAEAAHALELGVHHWQVIPPGVPEESLPALVATGRAFAHARWRHERTLRLALARAQAQLDERKWVDRAKGMLMTTRGLAEDDAFRLLRGAAMDANLRVGELSRAVFEAAHWAHAINRAGQLRMLSQRFVRLAAQRLLRIAPRDAGSLQQDSARRVRENLATLMRRCAGTVAEASCAEAVRCWTLLETELGKRLDGAALARIDARAAALLAAADDLVQALQAAAGRRALHIVNLCGRQRMRVQRLAKAHLMAALDLPATGDSNTPPAQEARALLEEFETAQRELEDAPLSSPAIRAGLARVREDWSRLVGGLRMQDVEAGARATVEISEALLARLEGLTEAYEHSLQVIMG